jgi:membrane protease YdiL (CAAX protease family)
VNFDTLLERGQAYLLINVFLLAFTLLVYLALRKAVWARLAEQPAGENTRGRLPRTLAQPALAKFAWGALYALAALALTILPGWLAGGFSLASGAQQFNYAEASAYGSSGLLWGFFTVQSLYEELLFRGIGMALLGLLLFFLTAWLLRPAAHSEEPRSPQAVLWRRRAWLFCGLLANATIAGAFAYVHLGNPNLTGLAAVNIALASLVLGQVFWMQGSIWGAWSLHLVWNAAQASLGLPVSGIAIAPPLLTGLGVTGARAGTLTGGAFGIEGSWPCTIALALLLAYLLWRHWRGLQVASRQGGDGLALE